MNRSKIPIYMVGKGTTLYPDTSFGCLDAGEPVEVEERNGVLYIPCAEGSHMLDSELSLDGKHYLGFSLDAPE